MKIVKKNKIIIKVARNKEPYVTVKGGNNKVVAVTETYDSLQGAKKAANALKRIVKKAVIVDKTKKPKK